MLLITSYSAIGDLPFLFPLICSALVAEVAIIVSLEIGFDDLL